MEIYEGLDFPEGFDKTGGTVVTVGTFDGVHKAHAKLIGTLTGKARSLGARSVVITFDPHPRTFFSRTNGNFRLLSLREEKEALIASLGVDILIVQQFDEAFASLTAEDFFNRYLKEKLGARAVVVGYDHSFGCEKTNAYHFLSSSPAANGIEAILVPKMEYNGITISSSSVRRALEGGDISLATALLGRPYCFSGPVVHGKQLGRTLGYPTANIQVDESLKLMPPDGVYAVRVTLDGHMYGGMMNSGMRPTVDDRLGHSIEVNIFDFSSDIYGRTLEVEALAWIRSERKFSSLENLKAQLALDAASCRAAIEKFNDKSH